MKVHGKGARNRVVAVPGQALRALQAYLVARGLPPLEQAPGEAPLVASVEDPTAAVGYRALYASVKSWFQRAIRAASLPDVERDVALHATLAAPHLLHARAGGHRAPGRARRPAHHHALRAHPFGYRRTPPGLPTPLEQVCRSSPMPSRR
jgi:hypothetical protein